MKESDLPCIQSETPAETRVFDGIKLTFENESNASGCDNSDRILEIRHCKSGRAEFLTGNGFIYLGAGDMYAGSTLAGAGYFPTGEYSGVKVTADIEKTPKCLSCFLEDVNVNPENLYEKFKNGYIARSDENTAHIFSEIYNVGGDIKMGYFKVKTLELFLFLSRIDILKSENVSHTVSKAQIELTCRINAYINSHADEHITLEMLSAMFNTSPTGIKNAYKSVFSTSFSSYTRSLRMKKAASLLKKTDMSILDAALCVGYTNASKFAKAFSDEFGITPKKYSKQ